MLAALVSALALLAPVGEELRRDPVYVDPRAPIAVDEDALRDRIISSGAAPLFIAVLPAGGTTVAELRRDVGEKGTYALVTGGELQTASDFSSVPAPAAHPHDLQAALEAFIDRTGRERADDAGAGGSGGVVALLGLGAVMAGGGALLAARRRGRRGDVADEP